MLPRTRLLTKNRVNGRRVRFLLIPDLRSSRHTSRIEVYGSRAHALPCRRHVNSDPATSMAPSRTHLLVNRIRLNSRPVSHPFYRTRLLHVNRRKLIHDSPCSHNTANLSRTQACQQQQSLRLYSTSETLEPPDHLDDREQKIFRQLRDALDPVSLQVYYSEFPNSTLPFTGR